MNEHFHTDVQEGLPSFGIAIDRVGLEDVKKRIEIRRKDGHYSMDVIIKAFVDLPANQRGAHMSRSAESIEEAITEQIFAPKPNIEGFTTGIARELLDKHAYAATVHVELEGPFTIQARQREGMASTQSTYFVKCTVDASRECAGTGDFPCEIFLSATAEGMIACPCGQEMSREFAKEMLSKRPELKLSEPAIDTILNVIPIATHNQRATGTITIQVPAPGAVDVVDLIDTVEASMSGRISGVLKRPDEANLIRIVHQDPMFTEDVVRRMAWHIAGDRFKQLPDAMKVRVYLVSMESIHPHQVSASKATTIGELRAALKSEKRQGKKK
nr:GTP cyclohydrolase MptA [Candidatus Sigynarchaeota archaeon]